MQPSQPPANRNHPINLCQPDTGKSCGACCGLYNWRDHSRAALQQLLDLQTHLFAALPGYEHLDDYRRRRDDLLPGSKLFDTIYNCEFLGFTDSDHRRVGCMLHPAATGGPDLRDFCFYGAEICSGHFCPGYACLTTIEQQAVVAATDDWYLYGLIITDIDLVKEFFRQVENSLGDSIKQFHVQSPPIIHALADYFRLKQDWKFRSGDNRLGKYFFSEAEYNIARIEYEKKWGRPRSRFDRILVSLESEFNNAQQLLEAESIIEDKINAFINVYEASQRQGVAR